MAEPIIIIKEPGPPPLGAGKEDEGHAAEATKKADGQGNPSPSVDKQRRLEIEFEGSNKPERPMPLSYESDETLVGSEWRGSWNAVTREVRISRVRKNP